MSEHHELDSDSVSAEDSGGFVALAVLAAALGAGAAVLLAPDEGSRTRKRMRQGFRTLRGDATSRIAQLQREIKRRKNQSRREKRMIALAGVLVGAGVAALLTPGAADVRTRLGGTLSRIKVGAIDRIDRLRSEPGEAADEATDETRQVRSVQELGRDPNTVF
ncbi:MAG TPA: YtxH domain-containing protein [Gemmatimonadales bacterium]|nr:YtxH domain-containing protein [Gemmatimonadales bacterium]